MNRDMRIRILSCAAALAFAVASGVFAASQPASPAGNSSTFSSDKGKFRITINGQSVGSEEFELSAAGDTWIERSSMTAHAPDGPDIKANGQIRLAADGSPLRYDWSAEAQKKATGYVDFSGATAKCSGDFGGRAPMRKDFTFNSPRVAVLDNNLYYHFAILARLYDWQAGGKQTFPVLIPQDMVPGTIAVESLGAKSGGGKYETLRASTPDLEVLLYLDKERRLVRLEVPSSGAVVERQ